jgi:hypothetical protein
MVAATGVGSGYGSSIGSNARCGLFVATAKEFVDGPDGCGHVGHSDDPFVDVPINGRTGQSYLQVPVRQRTEPDGSLRIPLDPYRADLQLLRPGSVVAVAGRVVVARTSVFQRRPVSGRRYDRVGRRVRRVGVGGCDSIRGRRRRPISALCRGISPRLSTRV